MINELIQKFNTSMKAVQNLQIQPTKYNCEQILTAITGIQEAADIAVRMNQRLAELEKAAAAAAEPAAETDAGAEQAAAEPDEFEDRER